MMRRRSLLVIAVLALAAAAGTGAVAVGYVRALDATVVEKLSGRRWDFPSSVYSEAFLIYPGLDLRAAGLFDRLQRLNYRTVVGDGPLRKGDVRRTATGLDLYLRDSPAPGQRLDERLVHLDLRDEVVVGMRDLTTGEVLYALPLEPETLSGLYAATWEQRREVPLAEIPPLLIRAVVLTEDRRFYSHHGVDPVGILRASLTNLRSGEIVQGGSTLTQQLMKNFFLSEERTFHRKAIEAVMALLAERRYGKDEILANYLNEIYWGQNGLQGIFGVWEAAQFYFARPPQQLSAGEVALLAGMIRAPNVYSPYRHPEQARARRDTVLDLLAESGDLSPADAAAAAAEPLRVGAGHGGVNAAPYFIDFLRDDLAHNYPGDVLHSEGLSIFTSIDVQLQELATQAVRHGLAELERRHPALLKGGPARQVQAALIAVRPQTGAILAMVGGRDYDTTQFNRAVHALRQPGSIFKPFVYLAAFEAAPTAEHPISPASPVMDEPFEWRYDGGTWRPANYRDHYNGRVTARRALELSLNAATARVAYRVGLDPLLDLARRLGITSPLPPYPSIVLGAAEVTPLEVAQAYAVIANQGLRASLRAANKVVDRQGALVERRPLEVERAVSPEAAFMVTHLMEGAIDHGTGQGVRDLGFTRAAAGKTGTTNDGRDAWFAGFTPELLAVVWIGFDDGDPLGLTGAEAAVPIWTDFMARATATTPPQVFQPPAGVALVRIDPYTGGIATAGCAESILEAFWRGLEPTDPCPAHSSHGAAATPSP
ncbi:MAG: PBP1A family penicillin-binding protein [Candidatus Binatia bacterium]